MLPLCHPILLPFGEPGYKQPPSVQEQRLGTSWAQDSTHQLGTSKRQIADSGREKTLRNVGIPRVFFVAGAGFEPATFGL